MATPKFTPGPWQTTTPFGNHGVCVDGNEGNTAVCGVIGVTRTQRNLGGTGAHDVNVPEAWANARLITAAPELFDAAKVALRYVEKELLPLTAKIVTGSPSVRKVYQESPVYLGLIAQRDFIRAALAKVEGDIPTRECPCCGGAGEREAPIDPAIATATAMFKCEDCKGTGRLPDSLEGEAAEPVQAFAATWSDDFVKPGTHELGADFFTDENGYTRAEREVIASLKVGETWTSPRYGSHHTVTRLREG